MRDVESFDSVAAASSRDASWRVGACAAGDPRGCSRHFEELHRAVFRDLDHVALRFVQPTNRERGDTRGGGDRYEEG